MNVKAAKNIILAQCASDGGKGIKDLVNKIDYPFSWRAKEAYKCGYEKKDKFLEAACFAIARSQDKDIRFFVTEDKDNVADFIIYFDIKIDGKRYQTSFHSFSTRWAKWIRGSVASRGNWDHKSNRETCYLLYKTCGSDF